MQDLDGYEVLSDYCLQYGFIMPNTTLTIPAVRLPAARSGVRNVKFSWRLHDAGLTLSGIGSFGESSVNGRLHSASGAMKTNRSYGTGTGTGS